MNLRSKIALRVASMIDPSVKNSLSSLTGREFLRNGGGRNLVADWANLRMNERELYSGYIYAAIRNRNNSVAALGTENLRTDASKPIMTKAKAGAEDVIHPYLDLLDASSTFSNYRFWYEIPSYIDLKGVYYLMVVRNKAGNRYGTPKEFKLLNPNEITRIVTMGNNGLVVEGYRHSRSGYIRDIPPEMIIEIRDFNPHDQEEPFSMAAAGGDSQFTLKQAGDYTRSSLRNNVNAPGIFSTDVTLTGEQLLNFKARIVNHEKGEPLFSDGVANLKWDPMQIELEKAALEKIKNISLEELLAITGMSRTTFGIEVSGVTRDTSKVQRDIMISLHSIPRLQLIVDALNQDYKTHYPEDYAKSKYKIIIDSPLKVDREAEAKDVEIRQKGYDLFTSLVGKGYRPELAAKYAAGEIGLDDIGEPDPEKVVTPPAQVQTAVDAPPLPPKNSAIRPAELPEVISNAFTDQDIAVMEAQQSSLQNAIVSLESKVVGKVIDKVTNAFDNERDIITSTDRKEFETELAESLVNFYAVILPLYARMIMSRRFKEFALPASFKMDSAITRYIKLTASRGASSHMDTILGDLLTTAHEVFEAVVKDRVARITPNPGQSPESVLAEARKLALDGNGQDEIVRSLRRKYADTISKTRATVIARSETNRAFTRAQYEADRQFIGQNNLAATAYKKWICRGSDPCAFCLAKQAEPAIPFATPFAKVGDTVKATVLNDDGTTTVKMYPVTYEDIDAGDIHPNGHCSYQLILE